MKVATPLADVLPAEAFSDDSEASTSAGPCGAAEAVVHPESTEQVAAALEWASAQGMGVVPMASGRRVETRGLDRPFVVLRMDRLRGIDIYEPADLTLTARAGTPLAELGEQLGAHRQWLPFDPPHASQRSLGGFVARGESGPTWMGYGEIRNHVLGMTVVTGDGRALRLGGRVVKNVAGFDLLKLVVGSRGKLAVITSVCVRAFPRPAEDRLLVLRGATLAELTSAARAVGTAPVLPVSSVLLAPARALGVGAALLVRLHGSRPTVDADQRTLERHCGVTFEAQPAQGPLLTEARDAAAEGAVTAALAVLPSRLPKALSAAEAAFGTPGGRVTFVADTYLGSIRAAADGVAAEAAAALRSAIGRLGGSLDLRSAESASDGATLDLARDEADLIAGLERVFDPKGVFWPCRR
jgi:glycolate oxidase FAD binding subunit